MNRDHYPKAIVPEHLVSRSIETMPPDTPFYVFPGVEEGYEPLNVYSVDGALTVRGDKTITRANTHPSNPLNLVGLMKTVIIKDGTITEGLIADLRFVENGRILDISDEPPADQEDFNEWLELKEASIIIDAFIAPEEDDKLKTGDKRPSPIFYGPAVFHSSLAQLAAHGDERLDKFKTKAKKQKKKHQAAKLGAKATSTQRPRLPFFSRRGNGDNKK